MGNQTQNGNCWWTAEPIRKGVVEGFLKSAAQIIPEPAENWKVTYALFSKSGFTAEAKQAMGNQACLWIDLDRLDRDLRQG